MNEEQQSKLPAIPTWQEPMGYPSPMYGAEDGFSPSRSLAQELGSRTLSDYLHAFMQRKGLITLLLIAGFVVGLATTVPKPLTYPSEVAVEIQGVNETFMGLN